MISFPRRKMVRGLSQMEIHRFEWTEDPEIWFVKINDFSVLALVQQRKQEALDSLLFLLHPPSPREIK